MNLYNAVAVAAHPDAKGRGVMAVLNDEIHYAREIQKQNSTQLDTFKSPNRGRAGLVHTGTVYFFSRPVHKHTADSAFSVEGTDALPRVEILYAYANVGPVFVDAAVKAGVKGIVLAGVGDGNATAPTIEALQEAAKKGVAVVRSSRTGSGVVARNMELNDDKLRLPVRPAPSILAADFARLAEEVRAVERAGADWIHVDVMDGHFVPNLTLGPGVVEALRAATRLPLDVHLMIEDADRYLDAFVDAGAAWISVHVEALTHLQGSVAHLRARGVKAGVAINPATPIGSLDEILPELDYVLLMTVNPGFGGQSFLPGSLDKLRRLARTIRERWPQAAQSHPIRLPSRCPLHCG